MLSFDGIPFKCVVRNITEYDSLKIAHAPQWPYESFNADDNQTKFKLSYQPLGSGRHGKIGHEDLAVYVKGQPIFVQYSGRTIKVSSYPFNIYNDSILIFNDTTGFVDIRIPYQLVFDIDSISGEITFVSPPPAGNQISICASKKLYDNYQARDCNMNYFNFSNSSIIGMKVIGDWYLQGFEKWVVADNTKRQIIYRYKLLEQQQPGGYKDFSRIYVSWIEIPRIPVGYTVVFQEMH